MRKYFLLFVFSIFMATLSAQTVENIQVEQNGEKLNINYRIGGSTSEQVYFVTLTCSIDGGPVFEPKSVIGDVGAEIRGGKSFNTIQWNVFNDVEEVGNVEFFVKVDLTSDERAVEKAKDEGAAVKKDVSDVIPKTSSGKTGFERKYFVAYSGSLGAYSYFNTFTNYWDYLQKIRPFGIKAGYMGNWGGYGAIRLGWDYEEYSGGYFDYFGYTVVGGVTKHIIGKKSYRLYGYAGLGIDSEDFIVEGGFTLTGVAADWFIIDIGAAVTPGWVSSLVLGVGYIF